MIRKFFLLPPLIFLLTFQSSYSQDAWGLFIAPQLGVRFPSGDSFEKHKAGFNIGGSVQYATSAFPFFLKTEFLYSHFPQNKLVENAYHQKSIYGISVGAEYLFFPIFASEAILVPFISFDIRYNFIERTRTEYLAKLQTSTLYERKFGFSFGAGVSIFLVDIVAKYYYLTYEPYVGFDFRLRLPVYISL
ncbi:MAG: hypothetical protein KJ666_17560 [Bacteroidetes bacterium]|nr:hypothetical protein [Bacteroidota bacterium]MBU2586179.1 hypothetical protein [Bacteroidota bacterium]